MATAVAESGAGDWLTVLADGTAAGGKLDDVSGRGAAEEGAVRLISWAEAIVADAAMATPATAAPKFHK